MFKTIQKLALIGAIAVQTIAFAGGSNISTNWNPTNLFVKATNGTITKGKIIVTTTHPSSSHTGVVTTTSSITYSTNTLSPLGINMPNYSHIGYITTSVIGYTIDLTNNTSIETITGSLQFDNNTNWDYFTGSMPFRIETQAPKPFVTKWNVSGSFSPLHFLAQTTGVVSYNWTSSNQFGSGTFNNATYGSVVPANIPDGEISLSINGTNFKRFAVAYEGRWAFNDVLQWGSAEWSSMEAAFVRIPFASAFSATDIPNLSNVTNVSYMFSDSELKNIPNIGAWDMSNVENMSYMFKGAIYINPTISGWNTASATNMEGMFEDGYSFNQSISGWYVNNVTNFNRMLATAGTFNQNLADWGTKLKSGASMVNFASNAGISVPNYDLMLKGFSKTNATNINLSINKHYCTALPERNILTSAIGVGGKGWTITDNGDARAGITNNIPSLIVLNKGQSATIQVAATGASLTYNWSNSSSTSAQFNTTTPGSYTVTITSLSCPSTVTSEAITVKYNLSITASNFRRSYGTENPVFTSTIVGLVENDVLTPIFNTLATSTTGIGIYAIEVTATGINKDRYELPTYKNGVLTITKANLTLTVDNFSKVYGTENPSFTGSFAGIVNDDIFTPSFSTTATSLTGIGTYDILATATGANINNYQLIITNSVLTITKANLTVTANNLSKTYGAVNPTFTSSVTGIVNNDAIDLSYTTAATELSNIGTYSISVSATGVNIDNYELIINKGLLTVIPIISSATVSGVSANGVLTSATS
ncbi:MAG: BspA family leucine-rich repeat surface protein, partial [Cytophagales bacterium]